ncbi:ATP-binding cassette domain-containing protein [Pseudomonas sp. NFXW11]
MSHPSAIAIESGERIVLCGSSGSGKSTLIRGVRCWI